MSEAIDRYVKENEARFLEELKDFLRIPSISTLPENKEATHRAADFVVDHLMAAGLEHVELIETERHPLVYADWMHAPGKPTVLCYGHFDVQPPDPLELWESPPFEPTERNGNLYARGSADDKGQMFSHIKAIEAIKAVYGHIPVNVKFLIEGEEEVGGESVAEYVAKNPAKLKADVALVSDTEMYEAGLPTLNIGLRGLVYMEIEARGPMRDLHSGLYGGAAPNAVFGLIELLAKAKDADGHIQIPGIYDDVEPPSAEEKQSWEHLPFDEHEYLKSEVGSTELTGEPGYSVFERTWARPTFEVHGIAGGFTGAGAKTVIPAKAVAKVSHPPRAEAGPAEGAARGGAVGEGERPARHSVRSARAQHWAGADGEHRITRRFTWRRRRSATSSASRRCSRVPAVRFRLSAISPRTWAFRRS